jgi:hypothetical protein
MEAKNQYPPTRIRYLLILVSRWIAISNSRSSTINMQGVSYAFSK